MPIWNAYNWYGFEVAVDTNAHEINPIPYQMAHC